MTEGDDVTIATGRGADGVGLGGASASAAPGSRAGAGRRGATAGALIRITITHEDRRLDVGVPTHTPLAEHLPGFVRHLGALDPSLVYGGYWLARADGTVLVPDRSLLEQGVADGELLTLTAGALQPDPQVYDDVVEAVGDAVTAGQAPWSASDSARTALATATAFLLVGATLLALQGHSPLGALVAGCAAVVIVGAAAALSRLTQPVAGLVLALTASVFGGVAGFLIAPAGPFWGAPMACAGAGALIAGLAGAGAIARWRDGALTLALTGFVVAIAGGIVTFTTLPAPAVYGVALAAAATLSNALPWLALSTSRITVVTPHSDQEIFLTPPPIDGDEVAHRYEGGHRLLVVLRIALTLLVIVATPLVVASGLLGTVLAASAFIGLMTSARRAYTRGEVLAVIGTGIAGLVVTGAATAAAHPGWQAALVVVLVVAAAVVIGLTLLSSRSRVVVARIADAVDIAAIVVLLPLSVVLAGTL